MDTKYLVAFMLIVGLSLLAVGMMSLNPLFYILGCFLLIDLIIISLFF
jgi:hypothetical protein